ncbi:RHS repeat-associated core domain-containing protein [Pirellulaceae bacterium SH449]
MGGVSLSNAIAKLAQTTANGGAGITFSATAPGRVTVVINSEDEISFSIADAAGRTVMSDKLNNYRGSGSTALNTLATWSCTVHDATTSLSGFGTVLVTTSVDSLGKTTSTWTDGAGRTLRSIDQLGKVTTMTYDPIGRKATESLAIASRTYTTTSEYNSRGELTKVTYPDSSISERTYHDTGALHLLKLDGSTISTRTYDDGRRLTGETLGNGVTGTRTYSTDNLLTGIKYGGTGTAIGNLSYTWNANKNKTSETIGGTMSGYGFTSAGTSYDDEDRLTGYSRASGTFTQAWNLTPVGDWNSITTNGTAQNRTHGPTHELLTAAGQNITTDVTSLFGSFSLHLNTYTLPPTTFASYIDEPVVRKAAGTGGTIHYYHRNQQYSITAMTTSTGAVAERYAYTAYGQPTILNSSGTVLTSSAVGNRYTYTGREWDETLGLHHFRARCMSPLAGRFLGRDPIGYAGSEWALYEFIDGRVMVLTDPAGLTAYEAPVLERAVVNNPPVGNPPVVNPGIGGRVCNTVKFCVKWGLRGAGVVGVACTTVVDASKQRDCLINAQGPLLRTRSKSQTRNSRSLFGSR